MLREALKLVAPRRAARALLSEMAGRPWHVAEDLFELTFLDMLASLEGRIEAPTAREEDPTAYEVVDGVAVLPLRGYLATDVPWIFEWLGIEATSTRVFRAQLARALSDAAVKSILIAADSPGGEVAGTSAAAEDVYAARGVKPIRAHAEGLCASACLYITSQASELTADEDVITGSIGTVWPMYDYSEMFAARGIKPRIVRSTALKHAPATGEKVTDEVLEPYRAIVKEASEAFYAAVRRGRGISEEEWKAIGDPGRILSARAALAAGLIDRIEPLDAALAAAAKDTSASADDNDDDAPEARITEDDKMDPKELEKLKAEIRAEYDAKMKAQGEEVAAMKAQLAEEAKKREEAEAHAAANAASQKASMIEQATKEGRVTAVNRPAIEAYAEKVDADGLKAFLAGLPKLTNETPKGETGDQGVKDGEKLSAQDKSDLEEIAGRFNMPVEALDPTSGGAEFDLVAYARKQDAENKKAGNVRVIGE